MISLSYCEVIWWKLLFCYYIFLIKDWVFHLNWLTVLHRSLIDCPLCVGTSWCDTGPAGGDISEASEQKVKAETMAWVKNRRPAAEEGMVLTSAHWSTHMQKETWKEDNQDPRQQLPTLHTLTEMLVCVQSRFWLLSAREESLAGHNTGWKTNDVSVRLSLNPRWHFRGALLL